MNREKRVNGISLIVLVITIIIIIILAGAVILSLSNSNVINKAKTAKEGNDFNSIREAVQMERTNSMFEGGTSTYADIVPANYRDEMSVLTSGQIIMNAPSTGTTKISDITNAIEKLNAVYIPKGFVASSISGEMLKEEGLVIYESATPVTSTSDQSTKNQFVWVPVDNYIDFVREGFGEKKWGSNTELAIFGTTPKTMGEFYEKQPADINNPDATSPVEAEQMYASVKKYKGFYIARYEASSSNGTVISKKNQSPLNNSVWGGTSTDTSSYDQAAGDDTDPNGAVYLSRAMYNNSSSVKSTLIYGVQWDAVMRWNSNNNINVRDSSSWGNYVATLIDPVGAGPINTGTNDKYKAFNIYDMAGNMREWTMEAEGVSSRVGRGGFFFNIGADYPAASREGGGYPEYGGENNIGFRPTMYIK